MTEKETNIIKKKILVKDYFLTQEEFYLIKNKEFGFLETHPQPLNSLANYYESPNYFSHSNENKSFFERLYHWIKTINIRYKFSIVSDKKKKKKLLDYGCGTGDFLAYAQKKKWTVLGSEPNEKARKIAQKKVGLTKVSTDSLSDISEKFDVITMWHVLEHIPNLDETLIELKSKIHPTGKLIFALPNFESFDAKFYKHFWAAYDVPRHLWHFSPKSFEALLKHHGMIIEKIYPLWFDSYYVSLLSEKYRKTKLGFFRALFIGTFSNFLALFSKNYSSVVYKIKIKGIK